jgi:hypothetical protein
MSCNARRTARATTFWQRASLSRFVPEQVPWIHIDLAASNRSGGLGHVPTDITGFGVRYTVELLQRRTMSMTRLRILRPDDWHLHVRDGAQLASVLPFTARQFARAIIMPNLKPPVTTVALAAAYRDRDSRGAAGRRALRAADDAVSHRYRRRPRRFARSQQRLHLRRQALSRGATTHSDAGVTAIEKIYPALEAMQDCGLVFRCTAK